MWSHSHNMGSHPRHDTQWLVHHEWSWGQFGSSHVTYIKKFTCLKAISTITSGFPGSSDLKESAYNARGPGSIPGLGKSPGVGNGNPLQYSCLENSMDRGAWQAIVHGVTESLTWLGDFHSLPIHKWKPRAQHSALHVVDAEQICQMNWTFWKWPSWREP